LSDPAAARLKLLEDERAIHRVLTLYCHTIDTGLTEAWLDCFTAEGSFVVRDEAGRELVAAHGRLELKAYFGQLMITVPPGTQDHLTVNPLVAVDADVTTADSYYVTIALCEQGPMVRSRGRYRDKLRRTASGWQFSERIAVSMRTPAPQGQPPLAHGQEVQTPDQ
jgi:hypothetical protein